VGIKFKEDSHTIIYMNRRLLRYYNASIKELELRMLDGEVDRPMVDTVVKFHRKMVVGLVWKEFKTTISGPKVSLVCGYQKMGEICEWYS
jgi:hypothetical protein